MSDPMKKVNPEETPKDKKIELTDDEAENAAGGVSKPKSTFKLKSTSGINA